MVRDMTSGSPVKLLISFSIPIILGNIFQQLYSMVDAIIVGQFVGVDALAAIGAAGSLCFLILGFSNGLTSGFSVIISQRFGAGNPSGVRQAVAMSVLLGAAFSAVITVVSLLATGPLLTAMQTPKEIMADTSDYLYVTFAGTTATMFFNLVSATMRALGDSKTPLYTLMIASVLNVGLDLLFVLQFNMGVIGTAYATVIAQAVSCLLCIAYIIFKVPILRFKKSDFRFHPSTCLQLLKMGIPTGCCFSITAIGAVVLQGSINSFGSDVVAAFTTGNKVEILMAQPIFSFGTAIAAYCGQNLGARELDRIRAGVRVCLIICMITCVTMGLAEIFLGGFMVRLFVSAEETAVVEHAKYYLFISGIFLTGLGLLGNYRNAVQGLGNGIIPMLCGAMELVGRVSAAWLLVEPLGYLGLCLAAPIAWFAAAAPAMVYYFKIMKNLRTDPSLLHG